MAKPNTTTPNHGALFLANFCRLLGAALLSPLPVLATADDWPQFRGRSGSATNDDTGLPESWSDENNVIWKTKLPGFGASSPVVVGDHVFLTCYSGYGLDAERPGEITSLKRHLLSIDRNDGTIAWERDVPAAAKEANYVDFLPQHGYATNTPACATSAISRGQLLLRSNRFLYCVGGTR